MRRLRELPILQKILIVNALILLLGALAGTWVAQRLHDEPFAVLALGFFGTGLVIMGSANYLVLRTTFRPLLQLSDALATVHKGERQHPVAETSAEPGMRTVAEAVDEMLDRLEGESRRYSSKLFTSIEEERRRIGRELHDDTSQTLAAALIDLELAEKGLVGGSPEARKRVANSKELILYCLEQIKLLVYDLRPSMLDDLGLVPALRWYVQSHLEGHGIEVVADFDEARQRLPGEIETALYRVAQESLANAIRHSMATRVTISLETRPGYASLAIIDNGIGFVPDEVILDAEGRYGLGLLSIRERVELLDGTVNIDSAIGRGTHVHVVVPLESEAA